MRKTIKDTELLSTTPLLENIGQVIQQARKKKGLTQNQVVALVGGTQGDYAELEQGKRNITLRTLLSIFTVLGLNITLADETGNTYQIIQPPAEE